MTEPLINLRVFSWNVGKMDASKLESIKNLLLLSLELDVIVLGLQEVSSSEVKRISKYCMDVMKPYQYRGLSYEHKAQNFSLMTLVFYSNQIRKEGLDVHHFIALPSTSGLSSRIVSNVFATKGALAVALNFRHKLGSRVKLFRFVNVHLPFYSEEITEWSMKTILSQFAYSRNVVVFGDFNSRSLVDDHCMDRLEHAQNSSARRSAMRCGNVRYVKSVSAERVARLEQKLNFCSEKPTRFCDLLHGSLVANDILYLKNLINKFGFVEHLLYYLPSYKIDPKTGRYSLKKHDDGRLAGFADRIIFNGDFTPYEYVKIPLQGNDHFPIALTLLGETVEASRRGSRTSSGTRTKKTLTRTIRRVSDSFA